MKKLLLLILASFVGIGIVFAFTYNWEIDYMEYANDNAAQAAYVSDATPANWLGSWTYRRKISIDSGDIDSDLSHYPMPILINSTAGENDEDVTGIFSEIADADRKKIAVTKSDGTTELFVEIEKWDSGNDKAVLWVSSDGGTSVSWTISNSSDTEIYLYYDSTQSDNTSHVADTGSRTEVWDSDFEAVWHLKESSGSAVDSTSNNNDGTFNGNLPTQVSGLIGYGQHFYSNSSDYIDYPEIEFSSIQSFTLQAAVNMDSFNRDQRILSHQDGSTRNYEFAIRSNQKIFFSNRAAGADVETDDTIDGNNHYLGAVHNDSADTNEIFIDGSSSKTGTNVGNTGDPTSDCTIGRTSNGSDYTDGILDEIRISSTARTSAWIKADYESQRDHILDWYAEEQFAIEDLQCYSEGTIKQQGSYSLKGVAVETDSLNDTLTRTIGDYLDLSSSDGIEYDIRASRTGSNIKIGIHDSGGTTTEHTANVSSADTNQTESWDISGVSDANKDDIDSIIITIVNADSANTFYIDDMKWGIDAAGGGSWGFAN